MKKMFLFLLMCLLFIKFSFGGKEMDKVLLGIDNFVLNYLHLVKGKRVGLITNPAGINSETKTTAALLLAHPDVHVVALYGPEHGVRGDAQAGAHVPYYYDDHYKVPVFSLYGENMAIPKGMLKNIDKYMRSFDTKDEQKRLESNKVKDIDVIIIDLQDIGTRIYTYVATMAYAMETCAKAGIPVIILDRPNPINGLDMEGPVLEYPKYSSFVGVYPIPVRHGMTIGELALLFNGEFQKKPVELKIIPMKNWSRDMWFDGTGVPWVMPSPNMPTIDTAIVYPGMVYIEGTNMSEGRGTTRPFELFGAPWIDGFVLTKELNNLGLKGIVFREAWFTPTFSKYKGKRCGGSQLHIIDRNEYRSFSTFLLIISKIKELYPDKLKFHPSYFDKIAGNNLIRKMLQQKNKVEEIDKSYKADLIKFAKLRSKYLLYDLSIKKGDKVK